MVQVADSPRRQTETAVLVQVHQVKTHLAVDAEVQAAVTHVALTTMLSLLQRQRYTVQLLALTS